MARVVLVLVLVLSPGSGLSHDLAEDCAAAAGKTMTNGVQMNEEIQHTITTLDGNKDPVTLFMMPESGFKAVQLVLHGSDGTHYTAWFPVELQDFQNNTFYQSQAWVDINSTNNTSLCFKIFKYKMKCTIDSPLPSQYNVSVVAHGACKWLMGNPPKQCKIEYFCSSNLWYTTTCKDPRTPPPTTTSSMITSIVIVVVLLALVVMVVVMVVFGMSITAIPSIAPYPPEPTHPNELHVMENDNLGRSTVHEETPNTTDNDLYEPYIGYDHGHGHEETPNTIDNDLYEPFSGYDHGHGHVHGQ